MPSMMLTEFETPVTAKIALTVPSQARPLTSSRRSSGSQPVRRITPFRSSTPSRPDRARATMRRRGEMAFVKSSHKPDRKAGSMHTTKPRIG